MSLLFAFIVTSTWVAKALPTASSVSATRLSRYFFMLLIF